MDINIHFFHHHHHDDFKKLQLSIKRVIMNQAELAQELRNLKTQNDKAAAEQAAAFKKLQDALDAAGNTTPEVDAAMAELKASIQADDDVNPDAPVEPPAEPV